MRAYGSERHHLCCPGHDDDSKKFDRKHRHRRWNTISRKNFLRSIKRRARREGKAACQEE